LVAKALYKSTSGSVPVRRDLPQLGLQLRQQLFCNALGLLQFVISKAMRLGPLRCKFFEVRAEYVVLSCL